MKTTAAALIAALAFNTAAHAGGIVFKTPVTYTEPVTYAAGVTYLSAVTYSETADVTGAAKAAPVVLEGIVVTPKHTYTTTEWKHHSQHHAPLYFAKLDFFKTPHWLNSLLPIH
jgi:hypothetical protein